MPKARNIPPSLKFELWAKPCVICAEEGDIEIDHIVPVAKGGTADKPNLQPLCFQCHKRKGKKAARSNEELRQLYEADKERHHLFAEYRRRHKFVNRFDWPSFDAWLRQREIAA